MSVNAVVCWKYHSLDRINSSIFLNLLRKYRTAGHLVFLQHWPSAGHLDTAFLDPVLPIMLYVPLLFHGSEASIVFKRAVHNGKYWVFKLFDLENITISVNSDPLDVVISEINQQSQN